MGKIILENIRIYAFHGCMEEEAKIGTDYLIDLEVETNLEKSIASDSLTDTVDYVLLNSIVKEEMKIRSKLIEHVAGRILDRIKNEIQEIKKTKIKISKINPPIGGDVQKVSVFIER
jgi:7,8-dihydroneopterin aldolase/epimerase/oxygenase